MYSKRIIAANVKRYETHQQRKLIRYSVKACREMVAKLDALLDDNGALDRKKRPTGLLKAEREFIRNEIAMSRLDFIYWCNPPEAPIWMGDFSFKPIGEVQVGDEVIGWTKRLGKTEQHSRDYFHKTKVLAVTRLEAPIVKVTMASGRIIRCTADHLWANGSSGRSGKNRQGKKVYSYPWTPAKVGADLRYTINPSSPSLTSEQEHAAAWLGGVYDGEGSCGSHKFPGQGSLTISQHQDRNPEVFGAIGSALKDLKFDAVPLTEKSWDCYRGWRLRGGRQAKTDFLNICKPVRRQTIERSILGQVESERDRVVKVEDDGVGEVISLQTESGNYVCWGYLSKNCTRYVFVRDKETAQLVLFTPNLAQRIVLSIWAEMEERGLAIAFLSIKARQLGISTLSEMTVAHRVQFQPNINAIVGSSDPDKSKLMASMMEICWDNQPWWMVPTMTAKRAGSLIEFGKQNSAVSIQHGTQFSGIARGTTTNCVHLSELIDFDNPEELVDASLMGAAHESPHLFLALESTAKGRDNWVHDNWRNSKENWPRTLLRPIFLPWYVAEDMYPPQTFLKRNPIPEDWEPRVTTLKCAEKAELYVQSYAPVRKFLGKNWKMAREQMWWWECKRDEAIKKRQLASFLSETPGDDIEAFQSTNASAFDSDLVSELRDRCMAQPPFVFAFTGAAISARLQPDAREIIHDLPTIPIRARWRPDVPPIDFNLVPLKFESYQEDPNGRLYIWEFPEPGGTYVIGADTADGIGLDRSVLQVIKLRDPFSSELDRQVAEFASAHTNARDLWPLALALGTYYSTPKPRGKIEQIRQVVECNGAGETVQYELQKLGWWHFHPWTTYDNKRPPRTNKIGWFTNIRTRSMAVDTIVCSLRDEWLVVRSPWFVDEMSSFERDEFKQSIRAGYGAHDDRIMAMAIALCSSYIDEITTDGRSFFAARKRPSREVDGSIEGGVRAADLTAQLLKDTIRSTNPYTGSYNPY